jgi:hypothetical protein
MVIICPNTIKAFFRLLGDSGHCLPQGVFPTPQKTAEGGCFHERYRLSSQKHSHSHPKKLISPFKSDIVTKVLGKTYNNKTKTKYHH